MEKSYILHTKNGAQLVTESQESITRWSKKKAALFRAMRSGIIEPAKISRRPAGLCGRRMRTVAVSFIVAKMEN